MKGQLKTKIEIRNLEDYATFGFNRAAMSLPRIYADFNTIEYSADKKHPEAEIPLTGYGTLASLARQRLRLTEGMNVMLYEPNDIECEAIIHFNHQRRDPAGRVGEWVARFDHRTIRDSLQPNVDSTEHPCIICGHNFATSYRQERNYKEICDICGTSVMAPMAPPNN